MKNKISGNEVRSQFIDFFKNKGHRFVPSASLVPGGDQTLLFTNAGMVQFKDVFLGTDNRDYTRAVNSQKCMRVSGKHNDLDDVGRDNTHHTFFEMLGNWSFGDYYKTESIAWAWELLTEKWNLQREDLWVTCFKDEMGEIPTDEEAAQTWEIQPGINKDHILYFGRKDNFWEMAETGPCGPCSEIHIDRGEAFCNKKDSQGHVCAVNGECNRFLELWNLVFIQYNRLSPTELADLPACHVDTGMGFERIVSVLQNVDSNYSTDILLPLMDRAQKLSGQSNEEREKNLTPYRVIADHCRAASFLIADGVVPGNIGRNYICRMIIRRASRFGSKIGLESPFLGKIAEEVVKIYGEAYPELVKNKDIIIQNLTQEEKKFHSTVEGGLAILSEAIKELKATEKEALDGNVAFELYATHGLPLEITKDVLAEETLQVDEAAFHEAMEAHRKDSGAGKEFGPLGGEDAEFYGEILGTLIDEKKIPSSEVFVDPYNPEKIITSIVSIIKDGKIAKELKEGEIGGIILPKTNFYLESGGQVSDTGQILTLDGKTIFSVEAVNKPAAGLIVHSGTVSNGALNVGDEVRVSVDFKRRQDIMRNHTATHILHAVLKTVLGPHVRQAGSLVAPDKLRFDFTHSDAISRDQINEIERKVNDEIFKNSPVHVNRKKLQEAIDDGAVALFGEKYSEDVRTISIGGDNKLSYELCGGTHVSETSDIGIFLITNESSAAAGIRRIEAVTGRKAYDRVNHYFQILTKSADMIESPIDLLSENIGKLLDEKSELDDTLEKINSQLTANVYMAEKSNVKKINGISSMVLNFKSVDVNVLRELADKFRQDFSRGIAVFSNTGSERKIQFIVTVTDELVKDGLHAGKIAKEIALNLGGSGGGRPHMAQAGGTEVSKIGKISEYLEAEIFKSMK